jgi:hypothetical protein
MGSLGRMIENIFFGHGRSANEACEFGAHSPGHARPCVSDRARYDSGTAFYSR